jgi:hypothetical protein
MGPLAAIAIILVAVLLVGLLAQHLAHPVHLDALVQRTDDDLHRRRS